MSPTEIVIVGLGAIAIVAGVSGALVAASGKKVHNAPAVSLLISLGRVVFGRRCRPLSRELRNRAQ